MSTAAGIVIGLSAVALVLLALRRHAGSDLGSVSRVWIVEHRADRGSDGR